MKDGAKNISQTTIVSKKDILEFKYNDNIFATKTNKIVEIKFSKIITAQHNNKLKKDSNLNPLIKANNIEFVKNVIRKDKMYKEIK